MSERWVSMEEICKHLGSSRDTVKKMVISYGMPAYKFDRKWKLVKWMHGCTKKIASHIAKER